jgi:hypothetical protein
MDLDVLLRLARASAAIKLFSCEPFSSEWDAGVLSAVWGGTPGTGMPCAFSLGRAWATYWLKKNLPQVPNELD